MDSRTTFSWLHFSDLHAGMSGSAHLWGQIKAEIFKDLRRHCQANGAIDLVVFSGDLTQRASVEEFDSVYSELLELWGLFDEIGIKPYLVVVPGNHDLTRPSEDSSLLTAVDSFRKRQKIREALLYKNDSESRKDLMSAFSNYETFISKLENSHIPLIAANKGVFPGDSSGVLEINGLRVGLVGLNSAWSHLEHGDFLGKLEFSDLQVSEAVGGDVNKWTYANHLNLLITHHPKNWFNPEALKDFTNEVNPLGRFDVHLFGHMHELTNRSYGFGGSQTKREFQAASLFGSEKNLDGTMSRRHGFSIAKLDAEKELLTIWPRKADKINGGGWRINIDFFELPDGGDSATSPMKVRELQYSSKKKSM
ncbi:metallophosphoesterase [Pseudomonas cichorii]|nr:metallophosphoesterase [Pseudomonas cichorii]MBX8508970.1 metallophosphoesterase [Pseudomonas cichorii]MBX8524533.1 metallophosphoesterase [Pseudomonas cichorii]